MFAHDPKDFESQIKAQIAFLADHMKKVGLNESLFLWLACDVKFHAQLNHIMEIDLGLPRSGGERYGTGATDPDYKPVYFVYEKLVTKQDFSY